MDNILDLLKFDYSEKNISGLNNELKSLFLLGLLKETNKSILIVTNTLYEANTLYKSISKDYQNTYLFPMDDFLTSEALAISPDLIITKDFFGPGTLPLTKITLFSKSTDTISKFWIVTVSLPI